MRKNRKSPSLLLYLLVSLLLLCLAIVFSIGIQLFLAKDGTSIPLEIDHAGLVVSIAEGVVAAIAAGLVLYQLRDSKMIENQQYNTEEAQFILEYNRSFIENKDMGDIEHYLEFRLTDDEFGEIKDLHGNRQKLVNYLVYLEGLASCIHGGILEFEKIDDLFAYRFFLAMNHPEVQAMELMPYATYYRGSFQLYEKWIDFRTRNSKYVDISGNIDIDIPLADSALHNCYGYEKYLNPAILLKHSENQIEAYMSGKQVGMIHYVGSGNAAHIMKYKVRHDNQQVLRALLKEFLYNPEIPALSTVPEEIQDVYNNLLKTKNILMHDSVSFRQLRPKDKLSPDQLSIISRLIYETDPYIYPDMFGNMNAAVSVLPDLIKSGKDSMFCLDNLFVCEVAGEIVGIILWSDGPLNWSPDELRKHIDQKHLQQPPKLDTVAEEYVSNYSDNSRLNTVSILNLCVSSKAQNYGIGTKLIQAFMSHHPNNTFELCVLSDNKKAIQLYESCGFVAYGEEKAYNPENPECMRKLMKTQAIHSQI